LINAKFVIPFVVGNTILFSGNVEEHRTDNVLIPEHPVRLIDDAFGKLFVTIVKDPRLE
jgi:hypothetical protein